MLLLPQTAARVRTHSRGLRPPLVCICLSHALNERHDCALADSVADLIGNSPLVGLNASTVSSTTAPPPTSRLPTTLTTNHSGWRPPATENPRDEAQGDSHRHCRSLTRRCQARSVMPSRSSTPIERAPDRGTRVGQGGGESWGGDPDAEGRAVAGSERGRRLLCRWFGSQSGANER